MQVSVQVQSSCSKLVYSRWKLLSLKEFRHASKYHPIPPEIWRKYRGCRAGVKRRAKLNAKAKKQLLYQPAIPSVLMENVNLLPNKMDELTALIKNQSRYRESSLIILSETRQTSHTADANVALPAFSAVRADRDNKHVVKAKVAASCCTLTTGGATQGT